MTNGRSLDTITAGDFRDVLGGRFPVAGGSGACVEVELVEVTEQAGGLSDPFRVPFSVLFHGPLQPVLPQGIYRLEHERLGAFDLFIVPIGPDESAEPGVRPTAMRYEAVFG
jgi:hypothetical protein